MSLNLPNGLLVSINYRIKGNASDELAVEIK